MIEDEFIKHDDLRLDIDALDDIYGMAISTHGRAGPQYMAQLSAALSSFPRHRQHDPLAWAAPTKRVQWQQALSVSFWTATVLEYRRQLNSYCKDSVPRPPGRHAFVDPFAH